MQYIFEIDKKDYSDFSSGRVLYNSPNSTGFPVRLANEIFQRALNYLTEKKNLKIYDPCCGIAYLLTVIGFLHYEKIEEIIATDYNENIIEIAKKNLALLSSDGINFRKQELENLCKKYGKESHMDALKSINYLISLQRQNIIKTNCQQRDITKIGKNTYIKGVHIVITDLPYGNIVSWKGNTQDPIRNLFENIYNMLDLNNSVVIVIANKEQKLESEQFKRVQKLKLGKRQICFFKPIF